jgi:protocatechuate 3,4-dioxygenase beta subunit
MKSARDRWLTTILALCTPCAALARDGEGAVLKTAIAGRVLNGAGQGIAGARVILWRGWRDGKEEVSPDLKELIVAETKTNAEGRYELIFEVPEDKQSDSVQLVFIAQGYGIHEEERISPSDLPPVLRHSDAVLGPDRTVSGRVTDHLGHPVPGILVQVGPNGSPYHPPRRSYGSSILFARTDADGRFEVRGVNRAGEPRLYLTRPNGRAMYHSWNTRVGDRIDARLPQLGMLEGRVVREATGEPVPGAEIQSEEGIHCRAHQGRYKAEADAEGRFRIEDVLPGEYSVVARASGAYGRTPCVRVHPAEKVACEVRAGPALNVSGVLVYLESGKPVANLRLLAGRSKWGYGVVMAVTGADGRFTFRGLLPARTSIRTYDDELASLDLRQGQPPADLRLELMGAGPDTRLIGTIRDADGQPVPEAWVGIPQWALR